MTLQVLKSISTSGKKSGDSRRNPRKQEARNEVERYLRMFSYAYSCKLVEKMKQACNGVVVGETPVERQKESKIEIQPSFHPKRNVVGQKFVQARLLCKSLFVWGQRRRCLPPQQENLAQSAAPQLLQRPLLPTQHPWVSLLLLSALSFLLYPSILMARIPIASPVKLRAISAATRHCACGALLRCPFPCSRVKFGHISPRQVAYVTNAGLPVCGCVRLILATFCDEDFLLLLRLPADLLLQLDTDGSGELEVGEIASAVRLMREARDTARRMRWLIIALVSLMALLVASIFGETQSRLPSRSSPPCLRGRPLSSRIVIQRCRCYPSVP